MATNYGDGLLNLSRAVPITVQGWHFPLPLHKSDPSTEGQRVLAFDGSVGELLVLAHSSLASFVSSPWHYIVLGNSFREDFLQSGKAACSSKLNIQSQRVSPAQKGLLICETSHSLWEVGNGMWSSSAAGNSSLSTSYLGRHIDPLAAFSAVPDIADSLRTASPCSRKTQTN